MPVPQSESFSALRILRSCISLYSHHEVCCSHTKWTKTSASEADEEFSVLKETGDPSLRARRRQHLKNAWPFNHWMPERNMTLQHRNILQRCAAWAKEPAQPEMYGDTDCGLFNHRFPFATIRLTECRFLTKFSSWAAFLVCCGEKKPKHSAHRMLIIHNAFT